MGNSQSDNYVTVITPDKCTQVSDVKKAHQLQSSTASSKIPTTNSNLISNSKLEEIQHKQEQQMHIDKDIQPQKFMQMRNKNTVEDAIRCMNMLGHCINDFDPKAAESYVKDGINQKVILIVCNTYTKPSYQLGVGPLNDSITVAVNHVMMGYQMIYLHNSTTVHFKKWLKFILKNTESDLTIFYTGHGCSVRDKSGDEEDGYDEVMLFDDGYVLDDELANCLVKYAHGQRIILLSDCCHSGSIWDIQSMLKGKSKVPANIISISAAKDTQTAKQTKMEQKDQGIFTYYFWKIFNTNKNISTKDMERQINPSISKFNQHFTYATTKDSMLNEPIFPHHERPQFEYGNTNQSK